MNVYVLTLIFVVFAVVGYVVIKSVPTLLHTPLMSGTNALSGLTLLGALSCMAGAMLLSSKIFACAAIFFAMLNVAGGFGVTERMLRMFKKGG